MVSCYDLLELLSHITSLAKLKKYPYNQFWLVFEAVFDFWLLVKDHHCPTTNQDLDMCWKEISLYVLATSFLSCIIGIQNYDSSSPWQFLLYSHDWGLFTCWDLFGQLNKGLCPEVYVVLRIAGICTDGLVMWCYYNFMNLWMLKNFVVYLPLHFSLF